MTSKSGKAHSRRSDWPHFEIEARSKRPGFWTLASLVLLPLLAYAAMFGNPLLWTDYDAVERTPFRQMDRWTEAWSVESMRAYDPLTLSSYFAEAALPVTTAYVHRALNLALHIGAVLLFFALLRTLRAPGAYLAALAFALHPAVVQPVFWPGYRSELLATALILLTLLLAFQNRGNARYGLSLAVAFFAGILHPAALLIPILIALGVLYREKHPALPDFNHVLPYACIALFAGVWTSAGTGVEAADLDTMARLNNVGENLVFFFGQTVLPLNLALFHPYAHGSSYQVGANLSLLPFVIFIPFFVLAFLRFRKFWSRSLLFGVVAFLVLGTYAAMQPGRFLDGRLAFETSALYLALPAALALVICHLAGFVKYLARPAKPLWLGLASLAMVLAFTLTASFAAALGDPLRMWQTVEEAWPDSWIPKAAIVDYAAANDLQVYSAEQLATTLEAILEQSPERHDLRKMLARTYEDLGQNNNANREYKRILRETEPGDDFLEEAARFFEKVGMSWDAQNARARIQNRS